MGILLAFLALFSWGLGDFLIQRSARKFGDWVALFYITAFASIILFPFIYHDLIRFVLQNKSLFILLAAGLITLFAALLDFEALRIGKISVIEPVYAFEVPVTVLLAMLFINEYLNLIQAILVFGIMFGIFLVGTRSFHHFKNIHLEKGVWYALFATIGMGAVNFLFGLGARQVSPLMINWFTSFFIALVSLFYLASKSRLNEIYSDWKGHKRLILGVSIVDNMAWVAFAYSTLYIPIAVTTAVSESYIALAATLGFIFNHEKLKKHQWVGLLLVLAAIIILSSITDA